MSDVIKISSGALDVQILRLGAALVGLRFAGERRNLVLGFANPADHAQIPVSAGHLVGPIANRVRAGRVVIGDTPYQMPLNENGETTLHSGPDGLQAHRWDVTDHTPAQVTLTCRLPDGVNGLPGNRIFTAHYAVTGTTLCLRITATTDHATPINIAAHPYWNLDGTADVSNHTLKVAAATYLPTDAKNLPTGATNLTAGTAFDLDQPTYVPLNPALDLNFCLAETMRTTPVHAATLRGHDGTTLNIATTCPGLQVYNGAHLPVSDTPMADCPPIAPYSGIALEPQHWPDAPNHSHFPQITLSADQTYIQITEYHLSCD